LGLRAIYKCIHKCDDVIALDREKPCYFDISFELSSQPSTFSENADAIGVVVRSHHRTMRGGVADATYALAHGALAEHARSLAATRPYHRAMRGGVANPANTLSFLAFAEHAWTGVIGLIVIDAHHGTMVWSMADAPHALELRAFAKNTNLTLIRDLPDNR
jgi:hypothetical protein